MYVRTKSRKNKDGTVREYLQIVETKRIDGKIRQKVLCTLGRLDQLQDGQLDAFAESLARFTDKLAAVGEAKLRSKWAKEYGTVVVFRRLWEELGLPRFLERVLEHRKIEFDVAEAVFAMVLNRLSNPMSKLGVCEWVHEEVHEPKFEQLQLHHFYRALDVLNDHKNSIEEDLYFQNRNLFNHELDIVFFDTTSTYFYGNSDEFRSRGHSKDHRSDCPQILVGVLMRRDGVPIAHEVFPGNTADITAFKYVLERAKKRFSIKRVIIVADRAMVSKETLCLASIFFTKWQSKSS